MSDIPETTEEPIVPPKKSMLIPIVVGVNSVALIGVAVMLFLRTPSASAAEAHGGGHETAAEASESKSEGGGEGSAPATVRMADFVIRLRDPEVDRYARVTFELEVATDADKARVTNSLPKLRDAFITYLSDRTMEELRGRDALEQVKKQLTETVTTQVPHLNLRGLYITEFVVQ